MTAIKICGLTRPEDVELAAALGAQFVGFVLWPDSPRAATLDLVRQVRRSLPKNVTPVGVFVDPSEDEVVAAADAGIRMAQIHGQKPEWTESRPRIALMRAVHLTPEGDIEPDDGDDLVLLDAHDPVKHGGTGKTVNWAHAAAIARQQMIFLAGGLTPENVRQAIIEVKPFAVDVASGVEAEPGVKDPVKLRAFIEAVKECV